MKGKNWNSLVVQVHFRVLAVVIFVPPLPLLSSLAPAHLLGNIKGISAVFSGREPAGL